MKSIFLTPVLGHMPGSVLGTGDIAVNETKIPVLLVLAFRGGKQTVNKINVEVNEIILDSSKCCE